jgi:hypothetical protein
MGSLKPRRVGCVLTAALAVAVLLSAPAAAVSRSRAAGLKLEHLRFRRVAEVPPVTNGPLTFFASSLANGTESGGTLVNELTESRSRVPAAPSCPYTEGPPVIGTGWLLFNCGGLVQLYPLPGGPWTGLNATIAQECPPGAAACMPVAIGRYWIEFDESCYHCQTQRFFWNISTGTVRADPTTKTELADLDSPGLALPLCSPVTNPADGLLLLAGQFAVVVDKSVAAVRRCGSALDQRLGRIARVAATPRLIVWWPRGTATQLDALELPTRKQFVVPLPRPISQIDKIILSNRHMYLHDSSTGTTWSAPISD